jgi:DNA-binding PadR family transcriptional regulator
MRNSYRFLEPVLLLMLKEKGHSYGYDLSASLEEYALTDARIERAALYRTLRTVEANRYVTSNWETDKAGPARRVYCLTDDGCRHLGEWAQLLGRLGVAMTAFCQKAGAGQSRERARPGNEPVAVDPERRGWAGLSGDEPRRAKGARNRG